jgi:probable phosphoglycerate mutase
VNLLLIRHALPLRHEVVDGYADPGLDPIGHQQAERVGEYLASERIDAIYASSMRRAQETAAPLAAALGLEIHIEPGVTESDTLAKDYVPAEDRKAAGDPSWRDGLSASEWPEYYEPLEQFHERIISGMDRIIGNHRSQTVAVFTHSAVIARYTSAILGHPWEQTGFFYPLYTSITRIIASRAGHRMIETVNETPHLRGTGLPTGALF